MRKLKTVFVINRETGLATDEIQHGAEWIFEGKGLATIKFDGSSVLKNGETFYRRMDRKLSKKFASMKRRGAITSITEDMFAPAKDGWLAAEEKPDLKTGHWPGWMPLDRNNPADKWHFEAIDAMSNLEDGTYELIGPTLQMNIYGLDAHQLVRHGSIVVDVVRTREGIKQFLENNYIEGLVFHGDGDVMFKVRRKDFGIVWNPMSDPRHYGTINPETNEPWIVENANINHMA